MLSTHEIGRLVHKVNNEKKIFRKILLTHVTRNLADEEDSEDEKPRVRKAVTVWRARKKEEAKLKKRYEVLCNKYQRSTRQQPAKH